MAKYFSIFFPELMRLVAAQTRVDWIAMIAPVADWRPSNQNKKNAS
jgi:hypothetical protein